MIAIAGVVVLAFAGLGVAVISAVANRHPDRAALLVVLTAAGGGLAAGGLLVLGTLVLGLRGDTAIAPGTSSVVRYSVERLTSGLVVAAALLAVAFWLVRTGDWRRPDD